MKKFFTLISAAFLAFAAQANVLTVCDGSAVNYLVPINGWYVDQEGTMSQMIYPAEMLTEMQNGKISQVKFYPEETIEFDACELQLAFKTVDQNGFETTTAVTGATTVSAMDAFYGNTELVFDLYQPYEYTGGNLLMEVTVTYAGDYNWVSTYFLGVETENNASYSHYMSYGTPSDALHKFLPKCTFTYEAGQVTPPEPPVVDEVGAPTFQGYTVDGIHGYGVYLLPTTEGSDIMYRVFVWDEENNEWSLITDWTQYMGTEGEIYMTEVYAKYRVEAYAFIGDVQSMDVAYEFVVQPFTGIDEMNAGKTIAGVRYFNMAGQEMNEANGLTIVVTSYTDGTTSAVKVVK